VSDYTAVPELMAHGLAATEAEAASLALSAGTDVEMVSRLYARHLAALVESGAVPETVLDEAVRRVLRLKLRAGIFESPRVDAARERTALLGPEARRLARRAAARSIVLLKNEGGVLPLRRDLGTLAVVGPLADDARSAVGTWPGDGRPEDAVTVLAGIRSAASGTTRVVHVRGCEPDGMAGATSPGRSRPCERRTRSSSSSARPRT
jgi:beta-glucosidase